MKEYRGDDFLYLVEVEDKSGDKDHRFFNQTDGSTKIEADDIDLDTKDRSGSDYGNVSETISVEGVLTQDDPAIPYIKKQLRTKKFVKITEVNTRTLDTETGSYKINSFEQSYSNGDFAQYSLEGTLSGEVKTDTLDEVPEGAPDDDSDDGSGSGDGGSGE